MRSADPRAATTLSPGEDPPVSASRDAVRARPFSRGHDRSPERCRGAQRRRADLARPRRGRRCLRRAVQPPQGRRPPAGPPAGARPGRRRPGLRGVRQGAHRAPGRRRARRGLPRLPADRGTPAARRPGPFGSAAADHRRHDAVRPGRAVPGHRGRRLRERCRGQGVRVAARALAAGAVAPRGRGPEAGRHRAAARHERQLGVRAGLPRPRGAAPGVPDHAPRRHRRDRLPLGQRAPRRLRPQGPLQARHRQGPGRTWTSAAGAPRCTSS